MNEVYALFENMSVLVGKYREPDNATRRLKYCERVGIVAYLYRPGCLHRSCFDGTNTILSYEVVFNRVRAANDSNLEGG